MNKKGSALLYIVLLLSLLLTMVLGLSVIISAQFQIVKGIGNSVIAFYAADAGIERMLNSVVANKEAMPSGLEFASSDFSSGASYIVTIRCKKGGTIDQCGSITADPLCTASNYCIKSVGTYKDAKRAIMVTI